VKEGRKECEGGKEIRTKRKEEKERRCEGRREGVKDGGKGWWWRWLINDWTRRPPSLPPLPPSS
jgi:hypothetical protein